MKTLSPEMEICRQSRSHDVAWLVEVDWESETGRYSSRPVMIGGHAYFPILAAIEGLKLVMPSLVGGGDTGTIKIELINTAEQAEDRFEIEAEAAGIEGRTARVGFVFLDPEIVLDASDIIWVQVFQIEQVALGTAKAVLHLRESPAVAGRKLVGRRLIPGIDPDLSAAAVGRMIPVVFGRIERAPLIPFRVGWRNWLREALQPEDRVVAVEDVTGFPDNGLVQIGDELISYYAVDRPGRALGSADSPVGRMAPAHHPSGTAVDWLPPNGFEYLVSDHRCRAVGPVYAGQRMVDPGSYVLAVESLGGREVQKVVFPTFPTAASYSATTQVRRIDGWQDPNLWAEGAANGAQSPLAPVDGSGRTSAAAIAAAKTPLEIEYTGDLSAGQSIHGPMVRCRLLIEYGASQRWSVTNKVEVVVGRGGQAVNFGLERPPIGENLVTFPAHSHADTIRDQIGDTRDLFEVKEQNRIVDFEEASAEAGWAEAERAIDGNMGSWCQNTEPGGPPVGLPLVLRLVRDPLGAEAVELEAVEFHARLATDETGPVSVGLDVSIANKFVDTLFIQAEATPKDYQLVVKVNGLTVEDLISSATRFAVRSIDGHNAKVYGAWLRLGYRPRMAGREQKLGQMRTGSVAAAAPQPVFLPTKSYRQEFDLTELVMSQGGWGFFAPNGGQRPFVRVSYGSASDQTMLWVSEMAFEVEYTPRTGVEVFDRFDATVEGIEQGGDLVENPADVIEWLVTDGVGLGWGAETIDSASFDQARQWLAEREWRLSRRLGAPLSVEKLLEEVAPESGCRLVWEAGRFRLLVQPPLLLASDAVATLGAPVILAAPLSKRGTRLGEMANVVRMRYGAGYTLGGGEQRTQGVRWLEVEDAGSAALFWGRRERELWARWHASSPANLVLRAATLLLGETAMPRRTVELDVPLSQCRIERGDVVLVEHPASRLAQAVGEVVGVEFVDGRYVRLTVLLAALGMYCWYGDTETFVAHLPGNSEKVFVIGGKRAAVLDRTGLLRLRGEVVENGLAARSMTEEIEHDGGERRLYFGVGSETAGYSAVFAVGGDGSLRLRGRLREGVDLSALQMEGCHRAEAERFLFSCDLRTALFDYEAAADRLDLAGRVIEGAPL